MDFPLQASLVGPLLRLTNEAARADFAPVWAGQAAPLIRELPAGQLVEELVAEAQRVFHGSKILELSSQSGWANPAFESGFPEGTPPYRLQAAGAHAR